MTRNPRTLAEWQEAVDGAEIMLMVESAKAYGLVEGGPAANVQRCEELLREGKRRAIYPQVTDRKIVAFIRGLNAGVTT